MTSNLRNSGRPAEVWYRPRVPELPEIQLAPGREKKIRAFYPWVQKGETRGSPDLPDGTVARLVDSDGRFVGVGTHNAKSRFVFRVFSLKDEPLDENFFISRFKEAKDLRGSLNLRSNALRTLFSEADRVPGLIVDEYDGHAVVQVRSKGIDLLRDHWLPAYLSVFKPTTILERSDMAGRLEEGMGSVVQPLYGSPPDEVWINEDDLKMKVLMKSGLKTGYYADQRNSRRHLRSLVQPEQKVLDCFCYTGGFALHAAKAGAKVFGVDIHELAIQTARENAAANGIECPFVLGNAFDFLEDGASALGPFDFVVLDPPAIAKTEAGRESLKWAIWKLVMHALPVTKPGGRLVVCNCSYQLSLKETIETCRLAAADRGERLMLEQVTYQDLDHPAPISFPEALYLKCVWLRRCP